ncbi:MAG TPA: adenylate/guanylate cyclase domain-containing protein [Actinomycetota bacterium]|nr:adenylate/guanylate cyclase domain-containing protein [Actinomycetota bacterium]
MTVELTLEQAAERAGVEPAYLQRLRDLGIVPGSGDTLSDADVRRALTARSLENAGISIDMLGDAIRSGTLNLDFLDSEAYERFSGLCDETFQQVSDRTGVSVETLMLIRESIGMAQPEPDDRMREDELEVVPFLQLQMEAGFRTPAVERLIRVTGDATRRISEQEAAWWRSEVIEPAMAAGKGADEIANPEFSDKVTPLAERALLSIYHAQQAREWTANIIGGFEQLMAKAGIHSKLERPPAICFLDITGYTRLTQEMGDDAAAELAATVARLVQRNSLQHGGKTIKWLGDGVMFYFAHPGPGVRAALQMADAIPAAGLPPVHVGMSCGPVLFQEGDYFGQTVNLSARIADYARPGEVLVTRSVVDASDEADIGFREIGPVDLKGVAGSTELLLAHLDRRVTPR